MKKTFKPSQEVIELITKDKPYIRLHPFLKNALLKDKAKEITESVKFIRKDKGIYGNRSS